MAEFYGVPGKKSSYHAKKFHNIGNLKLKKQKYFEALDNFNKSLCLAEEGSEDASLAYASRSEVYAEVNEIRKCLLLKNPSRNPSKIKQIEIYKSTESENSDKNTSDDDPWRFYKLSFPPNDKIPFVSNCLEIQNDENFGRYITTKQCLKPGDIIAIEEPFFKIVHSSASHLRCANCLKSNKMNLIPSNLSSSSMFCSSLCQSEALKIFHRHEVGLRYIDFTQKILLEALEICDGSFEKLKSLCEDSSLSSQTFFDFDWNDEKNVKNKMHGLLAFNSLQLGPINDELDYVKTHPVLNLFKTEREKEIAKAFMTRIARILTVNCYSLDWWSPKKEGDDSFLLSNKMKVGSAILIFGSLFNHSCAPNIDRMIVDNKFVFIVRRPINKGEQLFISYGPSFTREPSDSRQCNLKAHFHFECSCVACKQNYPFSFNNYLKKDILTISDELISTTDPWRSEFRRNCEAIVEHQSKFPSHVLCKIMDRNLYLLAIIARNEPFLF